MIFHTKYDRTEIIQLLINLSEEGTKLVTEEEVLKSLGVAVGSIDAWAISFLLKGDTHAMIDMWDDELKKGLGKISPKMKEAYKHFDDFMDGTFKPYFKKINFEAISQTLGNWEAGMTC